MRAAEVRIVSIGECTVDEYSDLQTERIGGISLNYAVNAKRCGADVVSLVSCAGDDYAAQILKKLATEQIDSSRFVIRNGNTARQKILLSGSGERIFPAGGYDAGVLASYTLNSQDFAFIQNHDILFCACFQQVEQLFCQAMQIPFDGWRVADFLDLSDFDSDPDRIRRHFHQLAIAFVSADTGIVRQFELLSTETDCLVVVTLGDRGSVALVRGRSFYEPAVPVEHVVDSTGCGDAFQAAFTVSYWRHRDVQAALRCGADQAARVIQHLGAID